MFESDFFELRLTLEAGFILVKRISAGLNEFSDEINLTLNNLSSSYFLIRGGLGCTASAFGVCRL
jgi:hypothetical protein